MTIATEGRQHTLEPGEKKGIHGTVYKEHHAYYMEDASCYSNDLQIDLLFDNISAADISRPVVPA